MKCLLVGEIQVLDAGQWARYKTMVPETLKPYRAKVLFRGSTDPVLSEQGQGHDLVIIEFPDADSIRRWNESPEYQALIPIWEAAAEIRLTAYRATG